jgi:hypothetical protein
VGQNIRYVLLPSPSLTGAYKIVLDKEKEYTDMVDGQPRWWAFSQGMWVIGIGLSCVPCMATSAERMGPPAKGDVLCHQKIFRPFSDKNSFVRSGAQLPGGYSGGNTLVAILPSGLLPSGLPV